MLKKFSSVCEKNQLSWFVDGGTLLGTVRHNAFIPWDDDIDVSMPRGDYSRLCQLPQDKFAPYFMQWRGSDWQAARGHAQLRKSDATEILKCEMGKNGNAKFRFNQGLFLDVFPIDFIPDSWRNGLEKELWDLKSGAWKARGNRHLCEDLQAKFDAVLSRCRGSALMHTMAVDFNPERFTPSECFERFVGMRFEDMEVPVPQGYECRLEHLYGKDWRTPRKEPTFHGGTFVDLDRPYTYYLQ